MRIAGKEFDTKHEVYMVGILNVTPDSFSDGGRFAGLDQALFQTEKMIREGAAIIDIGGESTRPGYEKITEEEEIVRVAPVIEAVKARWDIPVSLDTYKSRVAREGIRAGADMINDIWGLRYSGDPDMADVIAKSGVSCILMHNGEDVFGKGAMDEVLAGLTESLRIAEGAGIKKENLILDPGVGFAKDTEGNREVIARSEKLLSFGCPVMMAVSRKSVIGNTLELPVGERLEGTMALTAIGVMKGSSFFRVHDVKENYRAAKMALAIREAL